MFRLHVHGLQRPSRSPSQRFRIEQFLPALEALGVRTKYSWLLDDADLADFYGPTGPLKKAKVAALAAAKCAWQLVPQAIAPDADVLFINREAFFLGPAVFERLATLRMPLVYDFDDAIWIPTISQGNRRFGFLKNFTKFDSMMALAHTVVAGNEFLADYARQFSKNVVVIPTVVDTDECAPASAPHGEGPVVIGWSGSFSTIEHFKLLEPVLERVKARLGDRVRFRVSGDASYRNEKLGIVGEAWSRAREQAFLQSLDVGLMPLPDDEWAKGKCGLKGLMYMATGVTPMMSPVGVNPEILRDGETGFLPRTDDEWFSRLCELVESQELRQRIGARAREDVVARYSVRRWTQPLFDVLRAAAGQ